MNLTEALQAVDTPVLFLGRSDAALAADVNGRKDALAGFTAAGALSNPVPVRFADVLLRLAQATRPLYTADVYDMHTHWALMRYLGIFESHHGRPWGPPLLSDAGRRVVGNQRRVLSEELGVGFAIFLGERWMQDRAPGARVLRSVDIDVALASGSIKAARARKSVEAVGSNRPDYILIADDPNVPGRVRVAMLECKGTKSERHSFAQLVRASHQLRGVHVAGRRPAGLAVSTVLSDHHIAFKALQLLPDGEAPSDVPQRNGSSVAPRSETVEVDIDLDHLRPESPEVFEPMTARGTEMAAVGIKASFAFLADFSGNDEAFQAWAPDVVRSKLGRGVNTRRNRVEVLATDGTPLIGVRNRISLPGGDVQVFMGIRQDLDSALAAGDPSTVMQVQRSVAPGEVSSRRQGDVEPVQALGSDGAALIFTPL